MRQSGGYSQKVRDVLSDAFNASLIETGLYVPHGGVERLVEEMACQLYERGYNITRLPKRKNVRSPEAQKIVDRFSKNKGEVK